MEQPKKPKFDPNKAYEEVSSEKPAFNPDLPFDEVKKKDPSTSIIQKKELVLEPTTGSAGGPDTKIKTFTGLSKEDLKTINPPKTAVPKVNKELKTFLDKNAKTLQRKAELEDELSDRTVTPENQDEISKKTDELSKINKEQEAFKEASKARERERQNYSKIGALTDRLATGSSQLGADIASIPELVYDVFAIPQNAIADTFNLPSFRTNSEEFKKTVGVNNAVKDYYKKEVSGLKQKSLETDIKYQDGIYDSFVNGDYSGGFDQLTNSFAESLPATTSIMVGGAAMKAPQLIAASSMMFGAGKNEQLKEENSEMNNNVRVANALATGLIQGATESLGTGSIGAAARGLVEREGSKKAVTILKDGLSEYYKNALLKNPLLASMSGEGLEEAFQGVAENAVDVATGVKPADYNIYQTMADDFIGGAFGGAVFGAGLKGIQQVTNYQDKNTIKTNNKKVFNLQNELQNPELSPESKQEITKTIDGLIDTNRNLVQKNVEHVESLSPKVKEELLKSIDITESTQEKAKQIKLDPSTTTETKQILLDNLKTEYTKANDLKSKILEGSISEVDVLPIKEQDKLKREALKQLTEELNPEGKKNIEITNEQITERANKNYSNQITDEVKSETVVTGATEAKPQAEIQEPTNETQEVEEIKTESPLKKELKRINVPQNIIDAIPDNTTLQSKFIVDTGDLLKDVQTAGIFDAGKNKIEISNLVNLFNESSKDKVLFHEAVHAASVIAYDNLSNNMEEMKKVLTKDQVESYRLLKHTINDYLENSSKLSKTFNYGLTNEDEFIAEFVSNKKFRDYIGRTSQYKESNIVSKVWKEILGMLGISNLNHLKIKEISSQMDNIFKISEEQVVPVISKQDYTKTVKVNENETIQKSNTNTDGGVRSGVKPVDEVRTTEQEDIVERSVSKTVEPNPSEREVEVKKETIETENKPKEQPNNEEVQPDKEKVEKEAKPKNDFERKPGKRTLLSRLIEGGNEKDITDSLKELNESYDVRNQSKADAEAVSFVDEVGTVEAINALKNDLIEETDMKMLVYNEVLNKLKTEIDKESLNNPEDREALIAKFQELSNDFDNAVRKSAQGLAIMNYIYNKDQSLKYNLSKLIREYKANDINGEIPAEVKAEFEKLTNQLKDVEERIKEAESRATKAEEELAIKNIQEDLSRKKEISTKDKSGLTEKEQSRKKELRNKFFGRLNDVTSVATMLADKEFREYLGLTFKAAKGDLTNFSKQVLKEIGDGAKKHMPNLFKEAEAIFNEVSKKEQPKVTIDENGKIKIPNQLFRDYVEAGETDIDVISQKIKEDISVEFPDVDIRDIRDALTGYGKQINPNKDEITSKINRLKEYGRLLSAYEDVLNGEMPKKSGLKRQKPEQQARELRKEVNRLAKELGLESVNLEEQWATAIDKIKSNLKNQIEDLDKQIANGERRKVERTETKLDAEAETLKSIRDEKRKTLDDLVGKPELTEEQKISRAESTLEKSISKLQEEIDTQNIAYKEKPSALNSAKLENLRAQKKGLLAAKQILREEAGLVEEKRLKTAKTRAKKQISDLEERIKNKDFAKKEVKPILADNELNNLRAEREEIYEHFEKLKYIQELKNRTKARKFLDAALESLGLLRAVKASLDLGLIGIQLRGFTYSELLRNPKELGKKFWKLFGSIGSQQKADKSMSQLIGHPDFPLAKKLDIGITQPDLRNEVREEMASGNLLNFIWNATMIGTRYFGGEKGKQFTDTKRKSIGDTLIDEFKKQYNKFATNKLEITEKDKISRSQQWKNVNAFEAVERGLSAYGNQLRFEEFVRGVDRLKAEGKDPINHPEDYEALASYIRTFSGRAKPAGFEMNQKLLNVFFFSFKNAVSVFQQLNPIWYVRQQVMSSDFKAGNYNKVSVANKMAMATFLKSAVSTMATMALLTAAYNAYKDDDDEELTIEKDPRSSDFGKLKIGKLRYDPWGGYVPLITLYARLFDEQVKRADGSIYKMGEEQYGIKNRFDATTRFLINKESPGFQMFHHYMTSTPKLNEKTGEIERVNDFGQTLSEDEAFSMYPIFLGSVRDAVKEDPDMVKSFLTALSITGLGNVQNYSSKPKSDKKEKGSGLKLPSPPKPPTPN